MWERKRGGQTDREIKRSVIHFVTVTDCNSCNAAFYNPAKCRRCQGTYIRLDKQWSYTEHEYIIFVIRHGAMLKAMKHIVIIHDKYTVRWAVLHNRIKS